MTHVTVVAELSEVLALLDVHRAADVARVLLDADEETRARVASLLRGAQ